MNRYALSFLNRSFDPEALDGQHSTNIQYAIGNIQSFDIWPMSFYIKYFLFAIKTTPKFFLPSP